MIIILWGKTYILYITGNNFGSLDKIFMGYNINIYFMSLIKVRRNKLNIIKQKINEQRSK